MVYELILVAFVPRKDIIIGAAVCVITHLPLTHTASLRILLTEHTLFPPSKSKEYRQTLYIIGGSNTDHKTIHRQIELVYGIIVEYF